MQEKFIPLIKVVNYFPITNLGLFLSISPSITISIGEFSVDYFKYYIVRMSSVEVTFGILNTFK